MITKMSHTTLFVLDQDKAYDLYVNKLGFKVHTDIWMAQGDCGDNGAATTADAPKYRWLTVTAPDQPGLEIILMALNSLEPEAMNAMKLLLEKGLMGAGVFHTNDCRGTYEALKAKGVTFKSEPTEQFYGTECILTDGCGNWFSMTQPKEH